MSPEPKPTERDVRNRRNQVYGHPISDKEWEHCKVNWMRPDQFKWLKEKTRYGR